VGLATSWWQVLFTSGPELWLGHLKSTENTSYSLVSTIITLHALQRRRVT